MSSKNYIDELKKESTDFASKFLSAIKAMKNDDAVSEEFVDSIYATAYGHLQNGQPDIAVGFFEFCLQYRPQDHKYAEAVARCYFDLNEYLKSTLMYGVAIELGADKIRNLLNVAKLNIKMGQTYNAYHIASTILDIYSDLSKFQRNHYVEEAYLAKVFLMACSKDLIDMDLVDREKHEHYVSKMSFVLPEQSSMLS